MCPSGCGFIDFAKENNNNPMKKPHLACLTLHMWVHRKNIVEKVTRHPREPDHLHNLYNYFLFLLCCTTVHFQPIERELKYLFLVHNHRGITIKNQLDTLEGEGQKFSFLPCNVLKPTRATQDWTKITEIYPMPISHKQKNLYLILHTKHHEFFLEEFGLCK
jgi:hypothetical protein